MGDHLSDPLYIEIAKFVRRHGDFDAIGWFLQHDPNGPLDEQAGKVHFPCPSRHLHSDDKAGDKAFVILRFEDGGTWAGCQHQTCKSTSGNERAFYYWQLAKTEGLGVDSMIAFSTSAQTEDAEREQMECLIGTIPDLTPQSTAADIDAILKAIAKTVTGEVQRAKLLQAIRDNTKLSLRALQKALRVFSEELVAIDADADDAPEITNYDDLLAALRQSNIGVIHLFQNADGVVVRKVMADGHPRLQEMTRARWRAECWERIKYDATKDDLEYLTGTALSGFPVVQRVVRVPVFAPNGSLRTEPGYHADLRAVIAPNLTCLPVADTPSPDEVAQACDLLVEAACDLPFSDAMSGDDPEPIKIGEPDATGYRASNPRRGPSSRAAFVAMTLQPFVRDIIGEEPCPNYYIDKPGPGTGADLLRNIASIIVDGELATATSYPERNEEVEKTIAASLRAGATFISFNNINRKVDCGQFAAAVTTGKFQARKLQVSEMMHLPVRCVWTTDGNNVSFSHEFVRRNVVVRLDSNESNPAKRDVKMFKHHPLVAWLRANRPKLVWACHTIVRHWVCQGMPMGAKSFASFERYAEVMSGIFAACGRFTEFLDNMNEYSEQQDDDRSGEDTFVQELWSRYTVTEFSVDDMLLVASEPLASFDIPISKTDSPAGQRQSMGAFSNKLKGRTFNVQLPFLQLQTIAPDLASTVEGTTDRPDGKVEIKVKLIKYKSSSGQHHRFTPIR